MPKQFNDVNSRRGAPMGRGANAFIETEVPRFVRLFHVRLDGGGYDDGGAYWGHGPALWCAIDDDGNRQFTRAGSRAAAALILGVPNTALKRGLTQPWYRHALAVLDGRAPMPVGTTRGDVVDWLQRSGAVMGQ